MTVKSWTEYRLFKPNGEFIATIASEADARQWAKETRTSKEDPILKFICMEVSVCEAPRRKFLV